MTAGTQSTSNGLRHTGTMFLSRTKPEAGTAANGAFQLQLLLFDRLAPGMVEPWRVAWSGSEADDFWHQHQADLQPGAVLQVTLERALSSVNYFERPASIILSGAVEQGHGVIVVALRCRRAGIAARRR